jgi:hypothetical protein
VSNRAPNRQITRQRLSLTCFCKSLFGTRHFNNPEFIHRTIDPETNPPAIELGAINHASIGGTDLVLYFRQRVVSQLFKDADNLPSGAGK